MVNFILWQNKAHLSDQLFQEITLKKTDNSDSQRLTGGITKIQ